MSPRKKRGCVGDEMVTYIFTHFGGKRKSGSSGMKKCRWESFIIGYYEACDVDRYRAITYEVNLKRPDYQHVLIGLRHHNRPELMRLEN